MAVRPWIYQRLLGNAAVTAKCGNRIAQVSYWTNVPKTKPYLTFRVLTAVAGLSGDDGVAIFRHQVVIMVHDVPGNYDTIDEVLAGIFSDLQGVIDPGGDITNVRWIDHSEDFRDDPMGVILKWSRYHIYSRSSI